MACGNLEREMDNDNDNASFAARLADSDQAAAARRWIALFEHPLKEERHRALAQVIDMGEAAVSALTETLEHPEARVRQGALRALVAIASPAALPALRGYLVDRATEIGNNRAFAAQALAASTSPHLSDRPTLFAFLQTLLNDPDPFVKGYAVEALGRLGDPRAEPMLQRAARDREPFVAEKAEYALTRLATHAVAPTLDETLTPEEIEQGLQSPDNARRELALRELRRRIDEHGFEPGQLVTRLLFGPNSLGRRSALVAVGKLLLDGQRPTLVRFVLRDDVEPDLLAHALRSLSQLGPIDPDTEGELVRRLEGCLRHRDLFVRGAATACLASLPPASSGPRLVAALGDGEAWIREQAAGAILRASGPTAAPLAPDIAGVVCRLLATLPQEKEKLPPRQDLDTIEQLLDALCSSMPCRVDPDWAADVGKAGWMAIGARAASLRIAGLSLLNELVSRGGQPRPPRELPYLRDLGLALTSNNLRVVTDALTVLEVALPDGCDLVTSFVLPVLHRGNRKLALRSIALLGRAGDIEARQALGALEKNDDAEIAEAARVALDRHRPKGRPGRDGWDDDGWGA